MTLKHTATELQRQAARRAVLIKQNNVPLSHRPKNQI